MAIASAVHRGSYVYVYNERGSTLSTIHVSANKPSDGLVGYTASTVSIRRGDWVYIYDERGSTLSTVHAR